MKASGYDKDAEIQEEGSVRSKDEAGGHGCREPEEESDSEASADVEDNDQFRDGYFNADSDTDTAEEAGEVSDEGENGDEEEVNIMPERGLNFMEQFIQEQNQILASRHDSDSDSEDNASSLEISNRIDVDNVDHSEMEVNIADMNSSEIEKSNTGEQRSSPKTQRRSSLEAINEHEVIESFESKLTVTEDDRSGCKHPEDKVTVNEEEKGSAVSKEEEDDTVSVTSTRTKGRRRRKMMSDVERERLQVCEGEVRVVGK